MKVFVTGATGFVGHEVLRQLLAAGHSVRALVRPGSEKKLLQEDQVKIQHGDVCEPETLDGALDDCEAIIHLVGIIREFPGKEITFQKLHVEATRNLLAAAESQGVKRYLQMSANGTREDATTPYHQTKWQAEQAVCASALDWTIFRPSLIYGAGGEFVTMISDLIKKFPAVPVIGDGQYRMSPVAVEDVAAGFVRALQTPASIGQVYHCCGPQSCSYDELLEAFGQAMGKDHVRKIHQPLALMKPAIALMESVPAFPITSGQLTMLLEGNVCDPEKWSADLGLTPTPLVEGLRRIFRPT
jgi:nucleoside-diphosphate-sugar epimerase